MKEFLLFTAKWNKASKEMLRTVSEILPQFSETKIVEVTLEEEPERHKKYAVRILPTIICLINGEEVKRAHSLDLVELINFIED